MQKSAGSSPLDKVAAMQDMNPNPSPPESPNPCEPSSRPNPPEASSEWFSTVEVPPLETEAEAVHVEGTLPGAEPASAGMGKEAFFALFRGGFGVADVAIATRLGVRLQSVAVHEHDREARAASDALYDIAEATPALHWMINPKGQWAAHLTAIGVFLYGKYVAISTEIRALQARDITPEKGSPENGGETGSAETG